MGLIYDNPDLAALTLTRLAVEESEGRGALEGRMLEYLPARLKTWFCNRTGDNQRCATVLLTVRVLRTG